MKFIAVICIVMIAATSFAWQTVGEKYSCLQADQLKKLTAALQQGDSKTSDFIINMQVCKQLPAGQRVTLLEDNGEMYKFAYNQYSNYWTYKDGLSK